MNRKQKRFDWMLHIMDEIQIKIGACWHPRVHYQEMVGDNRSSKVNILSHPSVGFWNFPKSIIAFKGPTQMKILFRAYTCVLFFFFNAPQQHITTEISSESKACVQLNLLSEFVQSNITEVTMEDHQSLILIHTLQFYGRIYLFC